MQDEPVVTVITPTYNRAHTLPDLYASLIAQQDSRFIWMVVDDGSKDDTEVLIKSFIKKNNIIIIYFRQENQGKHVALNRGIKQINTEITFIVDSDDILTPDAIGTVISEWEKHKSKSLCGISFLRGFSRYEVIGDKHPRDRMVDSFINVRFNMNIGGDKAEVWKTSLLKQTPFLQFENEKFLGESYVWIRLGKNYPMLFINKIIYITKYLEGGLTQSGRKLRINCPLGGMANSKEALSKEFFLRQRIKNAWLYICYGFFAKKSVSYMVRYSNHPVLIVLNLPFGYALYWYWKYKYLE